jgi:hypothetical protein
MKRLLEEIKVRWKGINPTICHNGRLANPLDPYARRLKKLNGKQRKTDEDYIDIAKAGFEGSLYWDDVFGPGIPVDNVLACLISGGKKTKHGKEVGLTTFIHPASGNGDASMVKLDYPGPRNIRELWNNGTGKFVSMMGVKIKQSRIMRCRPIFPDWSLDLLVKFDPQVIDREVLFQSMTDAGFYVGLSDFRPRYGRFTVEEIK